MINFYFFLKTVFQVTNVGFLHCIVCPSIYDSWLSLWYFQTYLTLFLNFMLKYMFFFLEIP